MTSDMMAYDIWIVVAGIFEAILELEIWIKFLKNNHILQNSSGLQTKYQVAKPEYKEYIGKNKTAFGTTVLLGNFIKLLVRNVYWPGTSVTSLDIDTNIYPVRHFY